MRTNQAPSTAARSIQPHSKRRPIFHSRLPLLSGYRCAMNLDDLIFTGFNKRVAALHRDTGEIVWQWTAAAGNTYTSLLLDGDRLIVCVHGYMYALEAATGRQLWKNEMSGFGFGVASLTSVRASASAAVGASGSHIANAAYHTANISSST